MMSRQIITLLAACLLGIPDCHGQAVSGDNTHEPVSMRLGILIWSIPAGETGHDKGRLPGGWKVTRFPIDGKAQRLLRRTIGMRDDSEAELKVGTISVVRADMRRWLTHHGIPDTPDAGLHGIDAGLFVRLVTEKKAERRIMLKPWIRQAQPARTTARAVVEILPDLGTSASPARPPAATSPIRLNTTLHRKPGGWRYIRLPAADAVLPMHNGQKIALLAEDGAAAGFGNAILSTVINGRTKKLILGLIAQKVGTFP